MPAALDVIELVAVEAVARHHHRVHERGDGDDPENRPPRRSLQIEGLSALVDLQRTGGGRQSSPFNKRSRSTNFWTFPDGVSGNSSTNAHCRGAFCGASRSRTQARSSASLPASWPGARRTTAATSSPHLSSGTPTTATSATAG